MEIRRVAHRVFVYGTLKKGFWNNPLLKGCEFFGGAATVPTYSMISVSHAVITLFPVIRPNENGKRVAGEIYTVDDEVLERLDRLEGVLKGMYSRELIDVTVPLANGERLPSKAFIHVAGPDGWQEPFDRLPPYSELNERGELDWRPGPLHGPVIR
jgi:gamma-glutamylaminecyclotransferase